MAFLDYVLSGLVLLAFSLPIAQNMLVFVVLPAAFGVGFGMNTMGMIWVNLLYELVPKEKLGRVTSVDHLGSLGMIPVGYVPSCWLKYQFYSALSLHIVGMTLSDLDTVTLIILGIC